MKLQNSMKKKDKSTRSFLSEVRTAVADYISTEGCSCCSDYEGHKNAMERLGKLIRMKKYTDGSGYDYSKYRTLAPLVGSDEYGDSPKTK